MLCEYAFAPTGDSDESKRELDDWAGALFARYQKNGQIWGAIVTGWVEGVLRATFRVPQADALDARHDSKGVTAALTKVVGLCSEAPAWRVIGDPTETVAGEVGDAPGLFLRADRFENTSPVHEGSDGTPVPLYLLPVDAQVREALHSWMHDCQLHYELWISSGRLESWAYQELSQPGSGLSGVGRELAKQLEDITGLATYYFLKHYWGRRQEDQRDTCPSCGGAWATEPLGTGEQGLDAFALRCDSCRLVSERATARPE
jgi:predicted  nucleic acid-binding Zn ribbon protein